MAFFDFLRQKWISRNPLLIFVVGYLASVLGVLTAYVIFPENTGLMGLAFTSLILQPLVAKLILFEETRDYRKKRISRQLFVDHSQTFKTMLLLFFGILLAFSTMYLYSEKVRVKHLFGAQLEIANAGAADYPFGAQLGAAAQGSATDAYCAKGFDCFVWYMQKNSGVMVLMLLLSIFYGSGAILFLAWNASVWGTVFAYYARLSALNSGSAKYVAFSALFMRVFPHTFLEASAYFLAVISGIVISKAYLREKWGSKRFNFVVVDGAIFFMLSILVLAMAAFVEAYVFS